MGVITKLVITHKCSTMVDISTRPAFLIDFQKIENFDGKKRPKSVKNFKLNIRMKISGVKSVRFKKKKIMPYTSKPTPAKSFSNTI